MTQLARMILLAGLLSMAACGGGDHAPDDAHAHDDGHEHGKDSHAHEAPETEAFYGDAASADAAEPMTDAAADAVEAQQDDAAADASSATHSHGDDEPHTHDH